MALGPKWLLALNASKMVYVGKCISRPFSWLKRLSWLKYGPFGKVIIDI
jgi:hypothetical protein